MQIGAADAAGLDTDPHLPGSGLRQIHFGQPQRLTGFFKYHRAHGLVLAL
jgi:hypothetical protein